VIAAAEETSFAPDAGLLAWLAENPHPGHRAATTRSLSCQRPLQGRVVEQRNFVSFGKLQGAFDGAAEVVGAGGHSQVERDGIEAIDKGFWKAQNDGTFLGFHNIECSGI
jgi:hypothetical protein